MDGYSVGQLDAIHAMDDFPRMMHCNRIFLLEVHTMKLINFPGLHLSYSGLSRDCSWHVIYKCPNSS